MKDNIEQNDRQEKNKDYVVLSVEDFLSIGTAIHFAKRFLKEIGSSGLSAEELKDAVFMTNHIPEVDGFLCNLLCNTEIKELCSSFYKLERISA